MDNNDIKDEEILREILTERDEALQRGRGLVIATSTLALFSLAIVIVLSWWAVSAYHTADQRLSDMSKILSNVTEHELPRITKQVQKASDDLGLVQTSVSQAQGQVNTAKDDFAKASKSLLEIQNRYQIASADGKIKTGTEDKDRPFTFSFPVKNVWVEFTDNIQFADRAIVQRINGNMVTIDIKTQEAVRQTDVSFRVWATSF